MTTIWGLPLWFVAAYLFIRAVLVIMHFAGFKQILQYVDWFNPDGFLVLSAFMVVNAAIYAVMVSVWILVLLLLSLDVILLLHIRRGKIQQTGEKSGPRRGERMENSSIYVLFL